MDFTLPAELTAYLAELDAFIEAEIRPLEQADDNIRFFDHRREHARTDWDNFETSWDFRDQPLLRPGLKGATLEASWRNWEVQSTAAIRRTQELETENNRLFIAAYGLDDAGYMLGQPGPDVSPEEREAIQKMLEQQDKIQPK